MKILLATPLLLASAGSPTSNWEVLGASTDKVLKIDRGSIAIVEIFDLQFRQARARVDFKQPRIFEGNNQPYDVLAWVVVASCDDGQSGFRDIVYSMGGREIHAQHWELSQVNFYPNDPESIGALFHQEICGASLRG
jgi:hypothetical protein